MADTLARLLREIEERETQVPPDYARRNVLVFSALAAALELGYAGGIRVGEDTAWPVVCFTLPDVGEVRPPAASRSLNGTTGLVARARGPDGLERLRCGRKVPALSPVHGAPR